MKRIFDPQRVWGPAFCVFFGIGSAVSAQSPQSAIPWLTDSLTNPVIVVPDPSLPVSTTIEPITVEPLNARPRDTVGLLQSDVTGFPEDLWRGLSPLRVASLVQNASYGGVPATRALFTRILLAQADPFPTSASNDPVLLARIDRLLEIGALEQAEALLGVAGADNETLFRRKFDIGLLTGDPASVCAELNASPMLSPSHKIQVFCLAAQGDWDAAATTLHLGEQLGQITPDDGDLLSFYLDENLLEQMPPPEFGRPFTPLEFLIRETVGLPRPPFPVPIAFLHLDLAEFIPVRYRMQAAERLVRAGVLDPTVLFAAYREETPAASGGIWDRSAAVQKMDGAATGEEIASALESLDHEFRRAGLRYAAALEFRDYLAELPPDQMPRRVHDVVASYLILADAPDVAAGWIDTKSQGDIPVALDIAARSDKIKRPITQPFQTTTPEALLDEGFGLMIARGITGEALFTATNRLGQDLVEEHDLAQSLALLMSLNQEETARDVAVQSLLLPLDYTRASAVD